MRRIILALLLAVCLMMAFAVPVFADGHSDFGGTVAEQAKASKGVTVPGYVLENHPEGRP